MIKALGGKNKRGLAVFFLILAIFVAVPTFAPVELGVTEPVLAQGDDESCESVTSFGAGWFICGFLNLVDEFILGFIRNVLVDSLKLDLNNFSGGTGDAGLEEIWNGFRVVANFLFIIAFLVVIIGQATSLIDNYTIKKMLPRIVIVAIAVQLSWFISTQLVLFFNALGDGVEQLIYFPFNGEPEINIEALGAGGQAGIFVGLVISGAAVGLGLLAVAPIAISALVGIILAWFTIIIRNILVITMVIASPIALVAWIAPNTERITRKWFDLFTKALLMYPLIVAFLAMGRVMGSLYINSLGGEDLDASNIWQGLIGISLFFGPLFMIPLTFKFAGSAIAGIATAGQNATRGKLDQFSQGRRARAAENRMLAGAGQATRGGRLATAIARPTAFAPGRFGSSSRSEAAAKIGQLEEQYMKEVSQLGDADHPLMQEAFRHMGDRGEYQNWLSNGQIYDGQTGTWRTMNASERGEAERWTKYAGNRAGQRAFATQLASLGRLDGGTAETGAQRGGRDVESTLETLNRFYGANDGAANEAVSTIGYKAYQNGQARFKRSGTTGGGATRQVNMVGNHNTPQGEAELNAVADTLSAGDIMRMKADDIAQFAPVITSRVQARVAAAKTASDNFETAKTTVRQQATQTAAAAWTVSGGAGGAAGFMAALNNPSDANHKMASDMVASEVKRNTGNGTPYMDAYREKDQAQRRLNAMALQLAATEGNSYAPAATQDMVLNHVTQAEDASPEFREMYEQARMQVQRVGVGQGGGG